MKQFNKFKALGADVYSTARELYTNRASATIFSLYQAGETEQLLKVINKMKPSQFVQTQVDGMSLLHVACRNEDLEFVKLLAAEASYFKDIVNDNSNKEQWTPIMWAAQSTNLDVIQELVANGASVTRPKADGITVLHMAASNNDIHTIDYLINLKDIDINVNVRNSEGWTPTHMAGWLNNFDAVNLLLENGANIAQKNANNLTCYEEIVRADNAALLECVFSDFVAADQAKRDMSTTSCYSLLHLAASSGPKSLQYLLQTAKETPNQICNVIDRATPLHFCAIAGNLENARILLRYDANPNLKDASGNTPMHYAVLAQNLSMVKLLEDGGADASIKNMDDISALDISVSEDILPIKKFFVYSSAYANYDFSGQNQHTDNGHSESKHGSKAISRANMNSFKKEQILGNKLAKQ